MHRGKIINSLPDEFRSYEEAANFWDTHDTTDYLDAFKTVEVIVDLQKRHYVIEMDQDIALFLQKKAVEKKTTSNKLANEFLRKQFIASN